MKTPRKYIPPKLKEIFWHIVVPIQILYISGDRQRLVEIVEKCMMQLSIEITNICNANCQFCAYKYQKRQKRIISNELFKHSLIQFVRSGGGKLTLTPIVGDPLIDRDLINKIEFIKKMKEIKYLSFFTNLIDLHNFNTTDFLLSGIDVINISTCIGSREMYRRIFGVDKYDSVMHNLERLLKENLRLGGRVKIIIHIKDERPYHRIISSMDYQRIVKFYGSNVNDHIDYEYDNWTGIIKEGDIPKNNKFKKIRDMSEPCAELYNGLIVYTNGKVGICLCKDFEAKLVIGNVYESSLEDIWKGKKLRMIRKNWLKGFIPTICRKCNRYKSLTFLLATNRNKILRMEYN